MPSIFTRIIQRDIPSIIVHEDELTLAIMDINPIQRGQILVFPKKEVSVIWDLENMDYQALMQTVKRAGNKIRSIFPDKARVGVIIEGLEVTDHAHVKVFPFSTTAEFHAAPTPADNQDLLVIADKLSF